jgi:F-type H+-transporting ATPase subunit b
MLSARRLSNACSIGKRRDPLTRTPQSPTLIPMPWTVGAGRRRLVHAACAAAVVVWMLTGLSAASLQARQQPEPARSAPPAAAAAEQPSAHEIQPQGEHLAAGAPAEQQGKEPVAGHGGAEGEAEHAESPWALVARIFNFAVLAGALVYLLRSPIMGYLDQRGVQVRSELTKAAELRADAAAQLAQIEAKMQALPGEVDALKRRGMEEIAAEEARIRGLADSERRRLLDQARREIDSQLRLAGRDLKKRAAELAVEVATERVKRTITDREHARLVERYVTQVRH